MWFVFVIPFVIFFIIFLLVAKSIFKSHKKLDDLASKAIGEERAESSPEILEVFIPVQPTEPAKPKEVYVECEYCGESVQLGQRECPSCGARLKVKK